MLIKVLELKIGKEVASSLLFLVNYYSLEKICFGNMLKKLAYFKHLHVKKLTVS
tara:strand:- start:501 stop:662 length:162 start_codon:yes stop_codon:yes gene_type:complete